MALVPTSIPNNPAYAVSANAWNELVAYVNGGGGGGGGVFTDDFNRADGVLGANWTVTLGTWAVASNKASCISGAGSDGIAFYNGADYAAPCYAQSKTLGANGAVHIFEDGGLILDRQSNGHCYHMDVASGNVYIYYLDGAAVYTQLGASAAVTQASGDIWKLERTVVSGHNVLTAYLNGVQKLQSTDSADLIAASTSGKAGYRNGNGYTTARTADDFECGVL